MYNNLKISVCLCTYNGHKYLKEQLNSLWTQSCTFDELIIIDDQSSDNTVKLLKEYSDKRCRISVNTHNLGPTQSFEQALKLSTGDLIFLCDQDDIWHPNKIQTMCNELVNNNQLLCLSNCFVGESEKTQKLFYQQKPELSLHKNIFKNNFHGCCLAFKKELLQQALPLPKNIAMHDWWLGLIATQTGPVSYLDEPLMFYRRHESAVTYKKSNSLFQKLKWRFAIIKNLIFRK